MLVNMANIFAEGPGGIIDIQVGPDGYMYVLSLFQKGSDCNPDAVGCVLENNSQIKGAIFRITPATSRSLSIKRPTRSLWNSSNLELTYCTLVSCS